MNQAGTHLIADLYSCRGLDDMALIEDTLRAAVRAIGATLIGLHLHPFGEGQGITGVAMLAESHMTIHSWPETGYAAIDIFVCGLGHDLDRGIALIADALCADRQVLTRIQRGA
ncbi:adenosylmethionine decarboxylase [uncultured Sphingomonas sp.]|uniref:adenosylmethionine decarboxylase n=1 Tax=uncultured Sphingomonas sp. TaxID=158754 RepID=UPI0025EF6A45|nr:adenosylmethionine decarboxylase [uncultured Sphingomonas sp.]